MQHGVYSFTPLPGPPLPTLIRLPGYPLFLMACFSIFGVEQSADTSHVTSFRVYDLNISPEMAMGATDIEPEEMSYPVLQQTIHAARAKGEPDYLAETELASRRRRRWRMAFYCRPRCAAW